MPGFSTRSGHVAAGRRRTLSATGILSVAALALASGHLLLKYYMPNPAFGAVGFVVTALILYYVLFVLRDEFAFVLVLYILSFFAYANNQGGLWNLIACGLLVPYLLMSRSPEKSYQTDLAMGMLLGVFLLWNVLGWVFENRAPALPEFLGIAALLGMVLTFNVMRKLVVTDDRLRIFFVVTFILMAYQLMVALNQHYALLRWNTPLLGNYSDVGSSLRHRVVSAQGTLMHFELFAESTALQTSLLVPFLASSLTQRALRLGPSLFVMMILIALLSLILTGDRSGVILFALALGSYILVLPLRLFSAIDRSSRQFRAVLALAALLPLAGVYFGVTHLEHKFGKLSGERWSISRVVSGKDINRAGLISMGVQRLEDRSWLVGYGFGLTKSNRRAWFGTTAAIEQYQDLHSLYLSLPELYGWIGAAAFLCMIILTWIRAMRSALKFRGRRSTVVMLLVGFSMFWALFLANEYKISILRNPNYYMLFWIWLGFANAAVRTIRQQQNGAAPQLAHEPTRVNTIGLGQGVPR